jgi:plastocyanin
MTWRSGISFSPGHVLGLALLMCVTPALPETISGRVDLRDSKDSAVKKKDYSGVVVWLDPVAPSSQSIQPLGARMVQKDKTFIPHVLAVRAGTSVDFPNFDPIFHNAFSNYNGQLFDVGLYPPGSSRKVRFTRPGVVRVFCNIHAAMSAVIVVLNTSYFDTTKKDGTFEIPGVVPGEYNLRVFHERATQATLDEISRRVSVGAGPLALPPLSISESGYIAIPHKNKYGREYGSEPDENGAYASPHK